MDADFADAGTDIVNIYICIRMYPITYDACMPP
jgi:hypothetical protein